MNRRVLIVDDDVNLLQGLRRNLHKHFKVTVTDRGSKALKILKESPQFAVLLTDMRMPEMTGLELLEQAKTIVPDTVRMMLTGNADQESAVNAVNTGEVFRFLNKPCQHEFLIKTLEAGLRQFQLINAERELLEKTVSGAIHLISDLINLSDPSQTALQQRVNTILNHLASSLDIPNFWQVRIAALVANLGSMTLPPEVNAKLRNESKLTRDELKMIIAAPVTAGKLLGHIPRLEAVSEIVTYLNKRFDGSGYPLDEVKGTDLPYGARVLSIVQNIAKQQEKGLSISVSLDVLKRQAERYDPILLRTIADNLFDLEDRTNIEPEEVVITALQAGHQLCEDLTMTDGRVLLKAGITITHPLREQIRNIHHMNKLTGKVKVLPVKNTQQEVL